MTAASVAHVQAPEVREKPILFSGPMVRAILAGQKTQTRRLLMVPWGKRSRCRPFEPWWVEEDGRLFHQDEWGDFEDVEERHVSPYGVAGDRLWVRETWRTSSNHEACDAAGMGHRHMGPCYEFAADLPPSKGWRPSIFMPRGVSRIALEVTQIRVQRLQSISEEDAEAEGVEAMDGLLDEPELYRRAKEMGGTATDARVWYAALWDMINGKKAPWSVNPWVWAVSFRTVTP